MKTLSAFAPVLAAGLAMTLAAGSALAQDSMMKSGSMGKSMSSHDMKMMKSCQAMSKEKMMADKGCMKMMKAHPDMMSGGDSMKSDNMTKR